MGSTVSAIIRIRNFTNSDISSVVAYDINTFDFGNSRPDKAFKGCSIPVGACIEKTLDFSTMSTYCPFTTKLVFKNGREDVFRINYKSVFEDNKANLKFLTKTHELILKKTGPRVLEIIVQNTEEQKENEKAEQLISDGCKLMELGKFTEASIKFMEAAQRANEKTTIYNVQNQSQKLRSAKETFDVDKKAKTLNNEGLQLLKSFKYQEALKKFEEALRLSKNIDTKTLVEDNMKIAKDAKLNQDAKKLNQEALLLRKNDLTEIAINKFDEALRLSTDTALTQAIRRNKAETLNKHGKEILKKAWTLDISEPEEAIHNFSKAKFLFQQAESVKPDPEYQQCITLVDCKLEGGCHFNTALQLENEGSRLIDKTLLSTSSKDCKIAKDKYEEAWKEYKEAQRKFEEGSMKGDCNFDRGVELTREALNGIERILNELEKAELEIAFA